MFQLTRVIRFCVDPLQPRQLMGDNAFAAKPSGEGLCYYLELATTLRGTLDPDTGFVVNVCDIDRTVRDIVVPLFIDRICNSVGRRRPLRYRQLVELLEIAQRLLKQRFDRTPLETLALKLTPYRTLSVHSEEDAVAYFSERFEFAAMHKLWNTRFSTEKNFEVFGKCANPAGHGHNYVVEVTVKAQKDRDFDMCALETCVNQKLIETLDHKSLNSDVPYFLEVIPTMENIAKFAWEQLVSVISESTLHSVTIWESDRTHCTYYGPL